MAEAGRERFRILLNYWIRHNREHMEDFRLWAERARQLGESELSEEMLEAGKRMEEVNLPLIKALEELDREGKARRTRRKGGRKPKAWKLAGKVE